MAAEARLEDGLGACILKLAQSCEIWNEGLPVINLTTFVESVNTGSGASQQSTGSIWTAVYYFCDHKTKIL